MDTNTGLIIVSGALGVVTAYYALTVRRMAAAVEDMVAATKEMVERSWTLPYEARAAAFDRASPSIQLAGTAAMLAEKIRGGPAGDRVELDTLAPIVNALRSRRPDDKRLQELATMFEQLRRLQGK